MLHKKLKCESINQNTWDALDAEEIKKQAQKEAINYIHKISKEIPQVIFNDAERPHLPHTPWTFLNREFDG